MEILENKNFKKVLEYFVAHLEWVENENTEQRGYKEYIEPLVAKEAFKKTGQGYAGDNIQKQISQWESYSLVGEICINIQPNYGKYNTKKCYLNWRGSGLNIIAKWNEKGNIVSLQQEEFIYWLENTPRNELGIAYSLEELGLYDDNETLSEKGVLFFTNFKNIFKQHMEAKSKSRFLESRKNTLELIRYKKQIILQGPPGTGKTKEAKLLAQSLLNVSSVEELKNSDQFGLIQFHPSYTYEDFVRGIEANTNGTQIEYKPVDKILAKFAKTALENYNDSRKESNVISYELQVREAFELFKEDVIESLVILDDKYELTPRVSLIDVDDSAFRYKGESGWSLKGNRMLFKDIIQAYLDGNLNRQDIINNKNLSGLAKQHASYFYRVLNMFQDFIKEKKILFDATPNSNVEPKNYVLVIDEINRANLSSVLGELIYALEYRGEAVDSMYDVDGKELVLPPNLYIIGTMNTADRSVGHIDYAIRRRFAFVDMLPKNLKITEGRDDFKEDVFATVASLFVKGYSESIDYLDDSIKIEKSVHMTNDFEPKDVWLGHSYFMQQYEKDENGKYIMDNPIDFNLRIKYEIKPILLEYIKDGILKDTAREIIEKLGKPIANA